MEKEILTAEQAIKTANVWLENKYPNIGLEIHTLSVEQRRYGWYMRYVAKGFGETNDFRGLIRGGSPLYVEFSSGLVHEVKNRMLDSPLPDVVAFERETFGFKWSK